MQRQYFDCRVDLTVPRQVALLFHSLLAEHVLPRQVRTFSARQPPSRIYSDASYEPDTDMLAGIGFVAFDTSAAHASIGMAAELPKHVLDLFNQRHQQITPCEAILGVIVPHTLPHVMAGRDVLWYIDNQAACEPLIKGSSTSFDLNFIASLTHLMFARLRCRVFFEHIESEANPADGLSRDGLLDAWTLAQGLQAPDLIDLIAVAASSLSTALQLV